MTSAETENAPYKILRRGCQCDRIEREPLFEWIDTDLPQAAGDDGKPLPGEIFTIPKYFEAHVALDYLEARERLGPDAAFRWAVIKAIGQAGWDALRSPGMDDALFDTIGNVILRRIRGVDGSGPKAS